MGNAPQLASRSKMWRTVIGDLEKMDAIGMGWPLACALHSHEHLSASAIGDVVRVAPDGEYVTMSEMGVYLTRQEAARDRGTCESDFAWMHFSYPSEIDMPCGHRCPRKVYSLYTTPIAEN